MRKALQAMLNTHFASASKSKSSNLAPSKEALDMVVESSNGDIRSAIMALQFSCVVPGKKGKKNATLILEATTRREQSLALFHLIGKVLYNKRQYFTTVLNTFLMQFSQARLIRQAHLPPLKLFRKKRISTIF